MAVATEPLRLPCLSTELGWRLPQDEGEKTPSDYPFPFLHLLLGDTLYASLIILALPPCALSKRVLRLLVLLERLAQCVERRREKLVELAEADQLYFEARQRGLRGEREVEEMDGDGRGISSGEGRELTASWRT
uniref:Uncharacterized protein n=1 Tax=Rhodotorula toruloides TaxID=5286 RepID=A0A0K3CB31_RHOTO